MKIRICHASDWHGDWKPLPAADLYILSGDMLPNIHYHRKHYEQPERAWQKEFIENNLYSAESSRKIFGAKRKIHSLRAYLQSTNAPIIFVDGNHDFTSISEYFGKPYFQINEDPTRTTEYFGLKIGGFYGVNYINGNGMGECHRPECDKICENIPLGLDIVVSHSPPYEILDDVYGEKVGVKGLNNYVSRSFYEAGKAPKLLCFGHVHECFGRLEKDGVIYSNAATGINVIELET